ncbi:hemagglutinin repeat-containing protein [Pandoraea apista]|uniref:hemagglutinin repeat-containing protein n=1 Tax=Pandoraea apista TaxID=93218 RepID=UPI002F26294E
MNTSKTAVIVSDGDTNIVGGNVSADKVNTRVGGDLNIASVQDMSQSSAHQQSVGGGFDVDVKGSTDLKGAYIASTADPSKNPLTTGTLTFSDIQNHSDYSANSFGFGGGGTFGNGGANERTTGPSSGKNTGGIAPMLPQSESGSERGVTRSGVSDGAITLTNGANQTQDLASLNRDTSNLNETVNRTPDLQNLLNDQSRLMAAATAAGEAVARDIGTYADKKREAAQKLADATTDPELKAQYQKEADDWKEGGDYRAAMHAAGGAIIAGLGGGNAVGGALGAGLTSKLGGALNELSENIQNARPTGNADIDQALAQIVATGVGTAVGAAVGGSSGAFTGYNVDRFNRQLHPDERQWAKDNAKSSAEFYENTTGKAISQSQAENMLLANGYRLVDASASKGPGGDAVAVAYIGKNAGSMFTATAAEYNNPFLYGNKDGSLTPEQRALPGAIANPKLGLAIAGALAVPAVLPALPAIPGAPIFGVDGALGSTAWTSATGTGAISAGINAGSQYYQNGTVNPVDAAIAAISGGVGVYGGLGWNALVNGAGGAIGTAINNAVLGKRDSIMFGGVVSGVSAVFGYGVGKGMETGINSILRPTINGSGWADVGKWAGPSGLNFLLPNNLGVIGAGVADGSGSEAASAAINGVKDRMGSAKKMMRLVLLLLLAYALSMLCFAAIKVSSVLMAVIFYGGAYRWGIEDVRFVLIRGSLMALVFWIVAILQYSRVRNRR